MTVERIASNYQTHDSSQRVGNKNNALSVDDATLIGDIAGNTPVNDQVQYGNPVPRMHTISVALHDSVLVRFTRFWHQNVQLDALYKMHPRTRSDV